MYLANVLEIITKETEEERFWFTISLITGKIKQDFSRKYLCVTTDRVLQ